MQTIVLDAVIMLITLIISGGVSAPTPTARTNAESLMGPDPGVPGWRSGLGKLSLRGTQLIKVPVSAWASASCSWSRGVCVNGGSSPRPAVTYSSLSLLP